MAINLNPELHPISPAVVVEVDQDTRAPLQVYDGPGWTWTPGFLNCIWVPMDFATTFAAWVRASAAGDEEGICDTTLRLSGMPFSFFHAFGGALIWALQIGYLFKESIAEILNPIMGAIGTPLMVFGLAFCVVQGVYESICTARAIELISHTETGNLNELNSILQLRNQPELRVRLNAWLLAHPEATLPQEAHVLHRQLSAAVGANPNQLVDDDLWEKAQALKDQITLKGLSYFDAEYISITAAENTHITNIVRRRFGHLPQSEQMLKHTELAENLSDIKRANLDRRVRPWCGALVSRDIKGLMQTLSDPNATPEQKAIARTNAEEMLQNLDTQAKKRLVIHIIGLTVIALVAAAFLITLLGCCPALIPFILISSAGVLSTFSYIYGAAALDERGWSFSWKKAFETALPPLAWICFKIAACCDSQEPEVDAAQIV